MADSVALSRRAGIGLGAAAILAALGLQIAAIRAQSITGDEPLHLLAGHQVVRYGINSLNLEHPPAIKALAALPLLLEDRPLAPREMSADLAGAYAGQAVFGDPARTARLQLRPRAVLLLFVVVPFLGAVFLLGKELGGALAGALLVLCLGASFGTLPYLSLVTTDTAVALGFAVALWGAVRLSARFGWGAVAAMGAGLGVALASKYSALLLGPPLALALVLTRAGARRRLAAAALVAALATGIVWATYAAANRHYDPALGRQVIELTATSRGGVEVQDRLRPVLPRLLAIERHSPPLAEWLTGLAALRARDAIGTFPTYRFGTVSSRGVWWQAPVLLLVKTPLALLAASVAAALAGLAGLTGRRRVLVVLAAAAAVFLLAAMASNDSASFRHLLPVLPVVYLPAALWAARRPGTAAALAAALLAEAVLVAPLWLSATNTWWLGGHNPTRFAFAIDSCENQQNFLVLRGEALRRGLLPLRVLHPVSLPDEVRAAIPEASVVTPDQAVVPGWYAVNVLIEQYLPAMRRARPADVYNYRGLAARARGWEPVWRAIAAGEDHGYVAGTFHLFRLPPPAGAADTVARDGGAGRSGGFEALP